MTVSLNASVYFFALFPKPAHGSAATLTGVQPGTVFDTLGRPVTLATADAAGTAALALLAGLLAGVYVVRAGASRPSIPASPSFSLID